MPWHHGGKEARYQTLLEGLGPLGVSATVYTMHWWKSEDQRSSTRRAGVDYVAIIDVCEMYKNGRRSIRQSLLFALACFKLLPRKLDIIEADQIPFIQLFSLWIISKVKRVPLVVTWHEYWGAQTWKNYLGFLGNVAWAVEKLTLKIPTTIITVSKQTYAALADVGVSEERMRLLENPINLNAIMQTEVSELSVDILCVGRLVEHKRFDLVLSAIAYHKDLAENSVLIIGEGPQRAELEAHARELGVESRVQFLGSLDKPQEVWELMKKTLVLAAPSEREGFGIAVAEALVAGTPVVTVDAELNYAKDLVERKVTGSVVTAGDHIALGDALAEWITKRPTAEDITTRFLHQFPSLQPDYFVERYHQILTLSLD
jgi:glycosyltransferase involved in cell wall biosynthesis